MPAGKATPTLPREAYEIILNWVNDREAKDLPTYTTPEIITRLMWQFAADVIGDPQAKEIVKHFDHIEGAFNSTVRKIHERSS